MPYFKFRDNAGVEHGSYEVFYRPAGHVNEDDTDGEPGWYWWACFPGCLPDSDPVGPFATMAEAEKDANDGYY